MKIGTRVTVVVGEPPVVHRATVMDPTAEDVINGRCRRPWCRLALYSAPFAVSLWRLTREDEGVEWARGWYGMGAAALRASVAMERG